MEKDNINLDMGVLMRTAKSSFWEVSYIKSFIYKVSSRCSPGKPNMAFHRANKKCPGPAPLQERRQLITGVSVNVYAVGCHPSQAF